MKLSKLDPHLMFMGGCVSCLVEVCADGLCVQVCCVLCVRVLCGGLCVQMGCVCNGLCVLVGCVCW